MATDPHVTVTIEADTSRYVAGMNRALMASFWGTRVVVLDWLPVHPSFGEQIRRRVRHGLADVLEWLGEDVGPEPKAPTNAFMVPGGALYVSQEIYDTMLDIARRLTT